MTTSNSTIHRLMKQSIQSYQVDVLQQLSEDRDATYLIDEGDCMKNFLLLMVDNFQRFDYSSEATKEKRKTSSIPSLSVIFKYCEKNEELLRTTMNGKKRDPLMPLMNDEDLDRIERAIKSGNSIFNILDVSMHT